MSESVLSNGRNSVRNSVFREFSLLLKRHNSDLRVQTSGEYKTWLDHLDKSQDVKTRRRDILNITKNIEKYEKREVPLIWGKVTELLKEDLEGSEIRMLLVLLSKCCAHCGQDNSVRLMFYFTLIDLCCNLDDKITLDDKSFGVSLDLIFDCINELTHQGTDIEFLEQEETMNLDHFLKLCLKSLSKFDYPVCLSFLSLLNNCLRVPSFYIGGFDAIMNCAQNTPNREVLASCLHTVDILIHKGKEDMSDDSMQVLVKLITGAINLNAKLTQQLLKTLDTLIESPYWPQFWEQLKQMIEDPDTPFLNLRGAVSILTDLAQQDKEDWLIWLTKIFKRGTSMYGQILECIKTLINDDHFNNNNTENHGYIWFNEENMCLLKMLRIVLDIDVIKQNNPLTIASIYDKLLDGLVSGKYGIYGFKDSVSFLSFIMEHKDVLSEDQLLELTKYFDSCDVPLPMNALSQVISILDPSKDFSTNIIRYITRIYKSLESAQLDSENIVIINSILSLLTTEESRPVFASCVEFLVAISGSLPPDTLLEYVEVYLVPKEPRRRSIVSIGIEHVKNKWKAEEQSIGLAKLFQRNLDIFPYMISMWKYAVKIKDESALMVLVRVLMKMRVDRNENFYFCEEIDMDGLTATFRRNSNIQSIPEEQKLLWKYPEDDTVPYIDGNLLNQRFDNEGNSNWRKYIDISLWSELLIETLRKPLDWEVYTYALSHLCPQLANFDLFKTDLANIETLHDVILHQLREGAPIKMSNGGANKSDVQLAIVRTCSSLFPYYRYLGKSKADEMIQLSLGVLETSFEKTIIPLLHNFTISCYEIPSSIKRYLNPLLDTISIRLTKKQAIPSILEFFIALSDSPTIISTLTLDQLKKVFAIAFKLIEVSRDLKQESEKEQNVTFFKKAGYRDEQEASYFPSTIAFEVTKPMAHFYLTVSYHIISHWFIRISFQNRPMIAPFLLGKLSMLEDCDDTRAYKDLITRFNSTDLELRVETVTTDVPHGGDPRYSHEYWYHDGRIVSIETNRETGESLVVMRGASGNSVFRVSPVVKREPVAVDLFGMGKQAAAGSPKNGNNIFTPGYIAAQFIGNKSLGDMVRIEDEHLARSVQLLDTIPVVEFHKVGLMYMGKGDKCERDILSHSIWDDKQEGEEEEGGAQFKWFINELGTIVKLRENERSFYFGGLDADTDGEYALIWHDQKCQIVFHAVSLMPNNDTDPEFTMKKRHVGNDFINIFWDERDEDTFPFDIIKSQFNFMNVVIRPVSVSEDLFKVKVYRARGVPGIFSTCHFKIMHGNRLGAYVRHLVTLTNTFAHIWHETSALDHCSTWSRRAGHIESIRGKAGALAMGASHQYQVT